MKHAEKCSGAAASMGSFYALSARYAKPELFRSIFKRREWHFHGQFKNNQTQNIFNNFSFGH